MKDEPKKKKNIFEKIKRLFILIFLGRETRGKKMNKNCLKSYIFALF